MSDPIIIVPTGGVSQSSTGSQTSSSAQNTRQLLFQVIGLVPLTSCDYEECRLDQQCDIMPVFGNLIDDEAETLPSYKNDFNSFLVKYPSYTTGPNVIQWFIEKAKTPYLNPGEVTEWEWEDVAMVTDDTYGILYKLGDITGFHNYGMFQVNWGKVVKILGPGLYRIKCNLIQIKITIVIVGGVPTVTDESLELACMTSPVFKLWEFDCEKADGTIKFETSITGSIGSIDEAGVVFNLCGIQIYDSLRIRGFFGYETTPKYTETLLEKQSGELNLINNKLYNKFVCKVYRAPKWVHDRLKSYGFMADNILVSDYNQNNSDYFIKQKGVRLQGNYEPTYFDAKTFQPDKRHLQRTQECKADFREDTESVIKSLCCPC